MSSQRRIDSSRANGAKSRGPITPEGRERSSMNALKHGCYAESIVLANESPDRFRDLLDSYTQLLSPQNQLEIDWVEEMAVAKWRQRRVWAIETTLLDIQISLDEKEVDEKFGDATEEMRSALAYKNSATNPARSPLCTATKPAAAAPTTKPTADLSKVNKMSETNPIPFPNRYNSCSFTSIHGH